MKKCLIITYSRTGNTRKVADSLYAKIESENIFSGVDREIIVENSKRKGLFGFVKSGYEAVAKKCPRIGPLKYNPDNYEVIILATPTWAGTMASPIRAYITIFRDILAEKPCFILSTTGDPEYKNTHLQFKDLLNHIPFTLSIPEKNILENSFDDELNSFISHLSLV